MGNSRTHGRGAGGPVGQDQAADIHAALVSATSQELKCDLFEYTRLPLRGRERLREEEEEGEEGAAQPPRGTRVWQAKAGLSWGCSDVICAPVGDRGEPTPPTPAGTWKSPNFCRTGVCRVLAVVVVLGDAEGWRTGQRWAEKIN